MDKYMPFSQWLEACGELAAIRHRLDAAGLGEFVAQMSWPQRHLEDGNLEGAVVMLNSLAGELEPVPEIRSAVLQLIAVVEPFEEIEKPVR